MTTLATHKQRPFSSLIDYSGSDCYTVGQHTEKFSVWCRKHHQEEGGNSKPPPEVDALWFYGMNQFMADLHLMLDADEPLGEYEPLVSDYYDRMQVAFGKVYHYLLLICTREARHAKNTPEFQKVLDRQPPELKNWYKSRVQHTDTESAAQAFRTCIELDGIPLGVYTQFLYDTFHEGHFSGGYGGERWAEVAHPLNEFVHGRISAEMLLDTAFTLAHNNGPIFNKGMLYDCYGSSC